jgi:uncharacterized protein YneF (UPF0154 family)
MKKLIIHIAIFFLVFSLIISIFIGIYTKQVKNQFSKNLKIKYLFLGDSHVQNGINPSLIPNSVNFASSGESYFNIYQKLQYIASHFEIENLVIPVGTHNFSKQIDTLWILNESNFISKISDIYPIVKFSDLKSEINHLNFSNTMYVDIVDNSVYQSIYGLEYFLLKRNPAYVGGFVSQKGSFDLKESNFEKKSFILTSKNTSVHQLRNFNTILAFCKTQNIKVTLIAIPVYQSEKNNLDAFIQTFKRQGFDFNYLNHLNLINDNTLFKDPNHLNNKGSKYYSDYLNSILTK